MKLSPHKILLNQVKGTISSEVRDHSNDPFVLRKNAAARMTIEKAGFPADVLKRQAEREAKKKL